MVYVADQDYNFETFDYITGDEYKGMSIAVARYYYLFELNNKNELKIAFHDLDNDNWTKWGKFPGLLFRIEKNISYLTAAVDVHRSMLPNEIVVESDYKTYDENYEAAKVIGKILEEKGFTPHYYYSGGKSIHIHIFLDWDCLKSLDIIIQEQLISLFDESILKFKRYFIHWLREKMISCWDTNAKNFDNDLIKDTHLIRAELSKNKIGYKTFLGYTHKDLSFVPYICNEKNRIYPKLGKIKLSNPKNIESLIEEFIEYIQMKKKKQKLRKDYSLDKWFGGEKIESVRNCVKLILNDDFKKVGDGYKRAMFILVNELKKVYGTEQARIITHDWNSKMGFPVREEDIEYRLKMKSYSLSCEYIHKLLSELGVEVLEKCKHNI